MLRDSTINRMIDESRKIQRAIIIWLIVLVVGIFMLINPESRDNLAMFIAACVAVIVSISAIILNALRVRGINSHLPPAPTVTYEDASDVLDFPQEHDGRAVGLENRTGNTISIGVLRLHRRQWRALVDELKKHSQGNKILWSRSKIENHNMPEIEGTDWQDFTSLTAYDSLGVTKFKRLTMELQSLDIVSKDGKRVTNEGWAELCRVAGLRVIL